jgi:hypothetical protein
MVTITCDTCGRKKPQDEKLSPGEWLIGYDLQNETPNAVSRSIRFLDHWDDRRVLEFGAIQVCSEKCKHDYVHGKRAAA